MKSLENEISNYTKFPPYISVKFTNASEEISSNQIAEDSILKDLQVDDEDLSFKVCDKDQENDHMPKSSYVSQPNTCYPKPAYSYLHLITLAFMNSSKNELSRSDIQKFVMKEFPYFKKGALVSWKKCILRDLIRNECFERIQNNRSLKTRKKWRMKPNKADDVIEELKTWTNENFEKVKIAMNPNSLPHLLKGK